MSVKTMVTPDRLVHHGLFWPRFTLILTRLVPQVTKTRVNSDSSQSIITLKKKSVMTFLNFFSKKSVTTDFKKKI